MSDKQNDSVIMPEILPPESDEDKHARDTEPAFRRLERAFGPILAGAFLDFMDLATLGPLGLFMGALAGYWIASIYRLPMRRRLMIAVAAGWYCMMPFTRFVPIATMIGAYVRYQDDNAGRSQRR